MGGGDGGLLGGYAEAADELAGQVLQGGRRGGAAVIGIGPDIQGEQRVQDLGELGLGYVIVAVGGGGGAGYQGSFGRRLKVFEGDEAGVKTVFQVVHRVGHVVGPVHDLGLQAPPPGRRARPDPVEDLGVLGVGTKFAGASGGIGGVVSPGRRSGGSSPRASRAPARVSTEPGVLAGGVEGGPGQVKAGPGDLGFEPGQQAQRLGVALEPAVRSGQFVEGGLAVVAERAVADVVG